MPTSIDAAGLNHYFGEAEARTQILFDISINVAPGQLVIMTGPSGSGKTTLLTLLGALRAGQSGKLTVLGREVVGLDDRGLTEMRRNIGFIFQMHNLIESITAIDNVMMATRLGLVPASQARLQRHCHSGTIGPGASHRLRKNRRRCQAANANASQLPERWSTGLA